MSLYQSVAPTSEPIALADAKLHLRITTDDTDSDALVTALISGARANVEQVLQRQLMPATFVFTLDEWPLRPRHGRNYLIDRPRTPERDLVGPWWPTRIVLPRPPLVAVTGVVYVDVGGTPQTLATNQYVVYPHEFVGEIWPAWNVIWPVLRPYQKDAVTITYTAGYASAAAVPPDIIAAIKLVLGDLYEHREAQSEVRLEDNRAIMSLLQPWRVLEI